MYDLDVWLSEWRDRKGGDNAQNELRWVKLETALGTALSTGLERVKPLEEKKEADETERELRCVRKRVKCLKQHLRRNSRAARTLYTLFSAPEIPAQ